MVSSEVFSLSISVMKILLAERGGRGQFNVPFKIISLISRRAKSVGGAKREYPGKST